MMPDFSDAEFAVMSKTLNPFNKVAHEGELPRLRRNIAEAIFRIRELTDGWETLYDRAYGIGSTGLLKEWQVSHHK